MKTEYAVTRTFSLTMRYVRMIEELSKRLGRSQSDLIREGIEDLTMKYELERPDVRVSEYLSAAVRGDGASE